MNIKALLFSIALVLIASWVQAQTAAVGPVTHVRDGDTIVVGDMPVRLQGVSAPELNQRHGRQSKAAMFKLVGGKVVDCSLTGEKSHDREVGICYLDRMDIAAKLVALGLARDCTRYSGGRYLDYETAHSKTLPLPSYCLP